MLSPRVAQTINSKTSLGAAYAGFACRFRVNLIERMAGETVPRLWASCLAVYNQGMAKHVIHITEKEATATNVATLLAHVRAGAEVIIENGERAFAVLHAAEPVRGRPISESIALAEAHAKELGYEPTMDPDFAADLEEIINSRKSRNISTWE
jgi:antitoxin (DNA-binding transcriptional repressor) of toxin-antitoxin stability system